MQKLKAATYCPVSSDPEDQERRKVYYGNICKIIKIGF